MAIINLVSTTSAVSTLLPTLLHLPTSPPSLYVDLEGAQLSRHGPISLLTLYVLPTNTVYIIDVHTLGATALSTPAPRPHATTANETTWTLKSIFAAAVRKTPLTLKYILESFTIPRVFSDVRNDSDALFAHFQIQLGCIIDLQPMLLASIRRASRTFLAGLASCIKHDTTMTLAARQRATTVKDAGIQLYASEKGGPYAVFNERPLKPILLECCAQDVVHMPGL